MQPMSPRRNPIVRRLQTRNVNKSAATLHYHVQSIEPSTEASLEGLAQG